MELADARTAAQIEYLPRTVDIRMPGLALPPIAVEG
jgi:hypothetical protein